MRFSNRHPSGGGLSAASSRRAGKRRSFFTNERPLPGIVVVEIPAKPLWCEIRNIVFSWTRTRFPFHTSSAKKLNVTEPPIITVTGKAFFDTGHAPKDQRLKTWLADCIAERVRLAYHKDQTATRRRKSKSLPNSRNVARDVTRSVFSRHFL